MGIVPAVGMAVLPWTGIRCWYTFLHLSPPLMYLVGVLPRFLEGEWLICYHQAALKLLQ